MSRVKPKEFWKKHVTTFKKSGMSQRAYCRVHGLSHRSLQYHLHKNHLTGKGNSRQLEKRGNWLPLSIVDEPAKLSTGTIRFHISKITIEAEQGCDSTILTTLLRAAGATC